MNITQTIIKYLKPLRKRVYLMITLSLMEAGVAVTIPLIYGRLVDQAINNQPLKLIGSSLLIWLILSLFRDWFKRIVTRNAALMSVQVIASMIADYSDHFLHLPMSYLKEQKTGKIINGFDRSSSQIGMVIERIVFNLLPDFITILLILGVLITVHWILSLILFVILFIYILITLVKAKNIFKMGKILGKTYRIAYGDHYEYLSSYPTVKAFSAEDSMVENLKDKFGKITLATWKNELVWNNLAIWQESIFAVGFVVLFGVGILMLRSGELTAGNLVSFIGYIFFTFGVLGRLGMYYSMFNRSAAEVSEANKIYQVQTESEIRHNDLVEIEDLRGEVDFKRVSFKYQGHNQPLVLNNMSFHVLPGEVIALVGESGAGKSTLVDLISGYYLPTKGSVQIDGQDSNRIDAKSLRRHIAIVPQEVSLFHDSIAKNIAYGQPDASQDSIEEMAKAANAHEFIVDFPQSYRSKVGERGVKLSVGQKQRVAIARALLRDPKILILDEATSSLDSVNENLVQEALKRLIKGRTTFIIAHRLSTIAHADRIFVLDNGKIVEEGKHQELLRKKGAYRKLYDAQKF